MKIHKYMAEAGIASRRKSEDIIREKRVMINDRLATIGDIVKEGDIVKVDHKVISNKKEDIVIMLHKPDNCVTTVDDQFNRKTVMDYIDIKARIYPIGRLDYHTTGLLLLTNNGEFANHIMHPRKHIKKRYVAKIRGQYQKDAIKLFKTGFLLEGKKTLPAELSFKTLNNDLYAYVTIFEGRNRQVRKMLDYIGLEVLSLKRVSIGNLNLDIESGSYRYLTEKEIRSLYD